MIHAYQETYLSKAQSTLGGAFDYAINVCKIPGEQFIGLFTTSSYSKRMESGEPAVVAGRSGIEAAIDIVLETTEAETLYRISKVLGTNIEALL